MTGAPDEELLRVLTIQARAVRTKALTPDAPQAPICDLVASLKTVGFPPERVLVQVKRALATSGLLYDDGSGDAVRQAVTWCVDAYYSTPVIRGGS